MARATVESQKGIRTCSSDKFSCSGRYYEVLVRDDIMISCPKSTIEAKNLGSEVELQTVFKKENLRTWQR